MKNLASSLATLAGAIARLILFRVHPRTLAVTEKVISPNRTILTVLDSSVAQPQTLHDALHHEGL